MLAQFYSPRVWTTRKKGAAIAAFFQNLAWPFKFFYNDYKKGNGSDTKNGRFLSSIGFGTFELSPLFYRLFLAPCWWECYFFWHIHTAELGIIWKKMLSLFKVTIIIKIRETMVKFEKLAKCHQTKIKNLDCWISTGNWKKFPWSQHEQFSLLAVFKSF